MNLKSIFAAEMARQIGHKTRGDKTTPISVAECTCAETDVTLTTTRGHWERAADDLRYGVGRASDGIVEQRLDNSLRALEIIRAGGAV